jgi:hypothetical protein
MRTTKKEEQILLEVYRAIYWEIGVNLDELIESGETKKQGWFLNYCLPDSRQKEIIESVLKDKKLSKWKQKAIFNTLYLGALPKSC